VRSPRREGSGHGLVAHLLDDVGDDAEVGLDRGLGLVVGLDGERESVEGADDTSFGEGCERSLDHVDAQELPQTRRKHGVSKRGRMGRKNGANKGKGSVCLYVCMCVGV